MADRGGLRSAVLGQEIPAGGGGERGGWWLAREGRRPRRAPRRWPAARPACGWQAGRGNGLFRIPARCVSGFRPVDAQDLRPCWARDGRTSRGPGAGTSMQSLGRLGERLGRLPADFPPIGQSCDPLVARSGFLASVPLSNSGAVDQLDADAHHQWLFREFCDGSR